MKGRRKVKNLYVVFHTLSLEHGYHGLKKLHKVLFIGNRDFFKVDNIDNSLAVQFQIQILNAISIEFR